MMRRRHDTSEAKTTAAHERLPTCANKLLRTPDAAEFRGSEDEAAPYK